MPGGWVWCVAFVCSLMGGKAVWLVASGKAVWWQLIQLVGGNLVADVLVSSFNNE